MSISSDFLLKKINKKVFKYFFINWLIIKLTKLITCICVSVFLFWLCFYFSIFSLYLMSYSLCQGRCKCTFSALPYCSHLFLHCHFFPHISMNETNEDADGKVSNLYCIPILATNQVHCTDKDFSSLLKRCWVPGSEGFLTDINCLRQTRLAQRPWTELLRYTVLVQQYNFNLNHDQSWGLKY